MTGTAPAVRRRAARPARIRRGRLAGAELAVLLGALGLAWAARALSAFPYDDAFIHFRVARNLAEHGQPYWNLGEPVLGDSSPLWMLIVAAGFALRGAADHAFVPWLNSAIVVAAAVVAHRLIAGRRPGTAGTAAGALFATSTLVPSAGGGMETPLAMLLLAGAALAIARERGGLGGALLALGAGCRYELLLAAPVAVAAAPRGQRTRLALGLAAVAAPAALWLYATYGALVPHTAIAKALVYRLTARDFFGRIPEAFGLGPMPLAGLALLAALCVAGAALMALGFSSPSALATRREAPSPTERRSAPADHSSPIEPGERASLAILGAVPAALAIVYAVRLPLVFPWYWPLLLFPALLGLAMAARRREVVWAAPPLRSVRVIRAVVAAASLTVAGAGALAVLDTAGAVHAVARGEIGRSARLTENARALTYLEIGAELQRRCPSATVLAAEIGALGWSYRGRIVDGVGLVSPEVLPHHPLRVPEERVAGSVGAYPAAAVVALRPDVIVALEVFNSDFTGKARRDPALARYAVVDARPVFSPSLGGSLPTELWGSRRVLVLSGGGCWRPTTS